MGLMVILAGSLVAQPRDWDNEQDRHRQEGERHDRDTRSNRHDWNEPKREDGRESKRNQYQNDFKNSAWFNADYRWGGYKRYVTYHHHRHSRPHWAPRYGDRYNSRYIFYEDYNLYYDCHRDVFVLWTGHTWVTTSRVPKVMYRIDFNRTRMRGVEYWDDDLDRYLNRKRPVYVNLDRW